MASSAVPRIDMPTGSVPPWPYFAPDEIEAAQRVLESGKVNYWTGTEGKQFEQEYADVLDLPHVIAMANGSVAIEAALLALGIGPGDDVLVTPRSFMASVSSVVLVGARPVFADVALDSGNVTAETLAAAATPATKAVIVVHLAGWPAEMPAIMQLAEERGWKVIEDCAQGHGARIGEREVGTFGHVATWSFCQDKIMTTGGEGGLLATADPELYQRAWSLKDHGKTQAALQRPATEPGFKWVHEKFGTNWRMTEMQSAIGRCQLRKLPEWVAQRRALADRYAENLQGVHGLVDPPVPADYTHAQYKRYFYIDLEALRDGWDRERILEALQAAQVPVFGGACPEIYREKAFTDRGWGPAERLPNAKRLGETSLMFLVHPTLTVEWIDAWSAAIREVFRQATR